MIEKMEVKKCFLKKFLCREKKMAHGKEIFGKCFFFAESFLFGSRQRSLCALGKAFLSRFFYFALGKKMNSRQSLRFW
jgi:hypothetical protein